MAKKIITEKDRALKKLMHYCAYQDRCHQEVRSKLLSLKIYGDDLEEIMAELISENFLNEERFAKSYARGKFRFKKWGKVKITRELKQRRISAYCIKKAMQEIDEEGYEEGLIQLLEKKRGTEKETNEFKLKGRLAKYAIGKGFESSLVWSVLKEHF
ncbi:MAG: regulatory protein RecX [Bacteroidota bacterium]